MTEIRRALWIAGAPARLLLLALIHVYRATLSQALGGRCRFHPTCSEYALDAVRTHGAVRGTVLAAWRVLRCSPLTSGGLDPVPSRGLWISAFRRSVRQRHTSTPGEAA